MSYKLKAAIMHFIGLQILAYKGSDCIRQLADDSAALHNISTNPEEQGITLGYYKVERQA
jgi:hypothetical protein